MNYVRIIMKAGTRSLVREDRILSVVKDQDDPVVRRITFEVGDSYAWAYAREILSSMTWRDAAAWLENEERETPKGEEQEKSE